MPQEIWKWISGYEGLYQVSSRGNVRSVDREAYHLYAKAGKYLIRGRQLKLLRRNEYPIVNLHKNGQSQVHYVHSMVLEAFIGPRTGGHQAHHKNGKRDDNRLENLEWVSAFEHKSQHVKGKRQGERHPCAKLTRREVLHIYELGKIMTQREIAAHYSVSRACISSILRGKTWGHLYG